MRIQYISTETPYAEVLALQESTVEAIAQGTAKETVLFVEHAPIYTCGTSANPKRDFLAQNDIPLIQTGRGGQITYHGPGQRVVYPLIDLKNRGRDLRAYVQNLQNCVIDTLAHFGIEAFSTDDVGVWVNTPKGEAKIAAIGIRVRKWVAFHGLALNIHPNLSHYKGIIPCGIKDKSVTSMHDLGVKCSMQEVDSILKKNIEKYFPHT